MNPRHDRTGIRNHEAWLVARMLVAFARGRHVHVPLQPGTGRSASARLDERMDNLILRLRLVRVALRPSLEDLPISLLMALEPPAYDGGWRPGPDCVLDEIRRSLTRGR